MFVLLYIIVFRISLGICAVSKVGHMTAFKHGHSCLDVMNKLKISTR